MRNDLKGTLQNLPCFFQSGKSAWNVFSGAFATLKKYSRFYRVSFKSLFRVQIKRGSVHFFTWWYRNEHMRIILKILPWSRNICMFFLLWMVPMATRKFVEKRNSKLHLLIQDQSHSQSKINQFFPKSTGFLVTHYFH